MKTIKEDGKRIKNTVVGRKVKLYSILQKRGIQEVRKVPLFKKQKQIPNQWVNTSCSATVGEIKRLY